MAEKIDSIKTVLDAKKRLVNPLISEGVPWKILYENDVLVLKYRPDDLPLFTVLREWINCGLRLIVLASQTQDVQSILQNGLPGQKFEVFNKTELKGDEFHTYLEQTSAKAGSCLPGGDLWVVTDSEQELFSIQDNFQEYVLASRVHLFQYKVYATYINSLQAVYDFRMKEIEPILQAGISIKDIVKDDVLLVDFDNTLFINQKTYEMILEADAEFKIRELPKKGKRGNPKRTTDGQYSIPIDINAGAVLNKFIDLGVKVIILTRRDPIAENNTRDLLDHLSIDHHYQLLMTSGVPKGQFMKDKLKFDGHVMVVDDAMPELISFREQFGDQVENGQLKLFEFNMWA